MDAKNVSSKMVANVVDGKSNRRTNKEGRTLKLNIRSEAAIIATACVVVGAVITWMGHSSIRTQLNQTMTNEAVPSNTWTEGPIESADGHKTLVAQFSWSDGYEMKNNNNYSVTWFDDAKGKRPVAITQFGQGITPYLSQSIQVLAPYYQLSAKNTDTVAHDISAWAYLQPN